MNTSAMEIPKSLPTRLRQLAERTRSKIEKIKKLCEDADPNQYLDNTVTVEEFRLVFCGEHSVAGDRENWPEILHNGKPASVVNCDRMAAAAKAYHEYSVARSTVTLDADREKAIATKIAKLPGGLGSVGADLMYLASLRFHFGPAALIPLRSKQDAALTLKWAAFGPARDFATYMNRAAESCKDGDLDFAKELIESHLEFISGIEAYAEFLSEYLLEEGTADDAQDFYEGSFGMVEDHLEQFNLVFMVADQMK